MKSNISHNSYICVTRLEIMEGRFIERGHAFRFGTENEAFTVGELAVKRGAKGFKIFPSNFGMNAIFDHVKETVEFVLN